MMTVEAFTVSAKVPQLWKGQIQLICKQTKGGMYDSHPLAYFESDVDEDAVIAFYSERGHNEGLTNWYALKNILVSGVLKTDVKIVMKEY